MTPLSQILIGYLSAVAMSGIFELKIYLPMGKGYTSGSSAES
jgi:hypothetical protein